MTPRHFLTLAAVAATSALVWTLLVLLFSVYEQPDVSGDAQRHFQTLQYWRGER